MKAIDLLLKVGINYFSSIKYENQFTMMASKHFSKYVIFTNMFYILFVVISIILNVFWMTDKLEKENNYCKLIAFDYCAYYGAGVVANIGNITQVYDLEKIGKAQENLGFKLKDQQLKTVPIPFVYLPVFLLPFQLLAKWDLKTSYWIWYFSNFLLLIWYLPFFIKKTCGKYPPPLQLLFILVSAPIFITLQLGQINVILLIIVGEFTRAMMDQKPINAGIWLAALSIKPQLLPLVFLLLFFWREWKTLLSFGIGIIVILSISTFLIGWEGWMSWIDLMVGFSKGIATNAPEIMMNWRMVGWHLDQIIPPVMSFCVVIGGSLITLTTSWRFIKNINRFDQDHLMIALLGIFTATGLVTWHSHFPTIIILFPFILFLSVKNILPDRLIILFVLLSVVGIYFTYFFHY